MLDNKKRGSCTLILWMLLEITKCPLVHIKFDNVTYLFYILCFYFRTGYDAIIDQKVHDLIA